MTGVLTLILALFLQTTGGYKTQVPQEYLVRNYTVKDGLPVNSVTGIVEDENGYLYFSTFDGLVRYDGYSFKIFNSGNSSGLDNDRFAGMLEAKSGDMWLLSGSAAVVRFDGTSFNTYDQMSGIPGQVIRVIEAQDEQIWVAATNGIAFFDKQSNRFRPSDDSLLATHTWAFNKGHGNSILAVNKYGLIHLENGTSRIIIKPEDLPISEAGIIQVAEPDSSVYWLMGSQGVVRISETTGVYDYSNLFQIPNLVIWDIYERSDDTFLFTTSKGLIELDTESNSILIYPVKETYTPGHSNFTFSQGEEEVVLLSKELGPGTSFTFQTPEIYLTFLDSEGSLWAASFNNGLYQIRKSSFTNLTTSTGFDIKNIYSVIEDSEGAIWASSLADGILRIGPLGTNFWNENNSGMGGLAGRLVYEDTDGQIYASFWEGDVWRFENNRWTNLHELTEVMGGKFTAETMFRDSSGRLIIGTRSKTVFKENGNYHFFDDALQGIRVIRENDDQTLLMGSIADGIFLVRDARVYENITIGNGLSSNSIRDIFVQSADTIWVATENKGLNRIVFRDNETLSISSVTVQDGLTNNSLHRIIEDPFGYLWISSNRGIMRVSKKALNEYANGVTATLPVIGFNEEDGMVNREANGGVHSAGILTSDLKLWFPNQNGITIIDPASFEPEQELPRLNPVIEWIALSDSTIYADDLNEVSIPLGERNLSFKLTAPNFAYPDRVRMRYKLGGVNPLWQVTNSAHEAAFTNLKPGTYTFDIAAERIGGSTSYASLLVTIPHYFYETTGFILFMVSLLVLGMYAGYKFRVRALQLREKNLEELVHEQTRELQKAAEQKSRFFTGITHELKTPLSLIVGPLDDIVEHGEEVSVPEVKNKIEMMHRNSHRLKNLVNQILDVTKLNADAIKLSVQPIDIVTLSKQVAGQFQSLIEQNEISFEFITEGNPGHIYVDKEAWERIIINLISNAIKFTPKGGRIVLSITDLETTAQVKVTDTGKGIPREYHEKVFEYLFQVDGAEASSGTGIGLFLVKGLIERMGGSITLTSEPGAGTEFILTFQKGYTHIDKNDEVSHEPWDFKIHNFSESSLSETDIPVVEDNVDFGHILIVEDNADFRSYLQSHLINNYNVHTSGNGKEALEKLTQITPDLIISDIMMPEMNGLEFVNSLREKEDYKHLPVIFLSAKNEDVDMKKGLSTGADIYLTKPINSSMLLAQIAAVLRRETILRQDKNTAEKQKYSEFEARVRELIYRQLGNTNLNVSMLADALFMGKTKLYKEWNKISKVSLNEYIKTLRFEEAKILLTQRNFTIQEAARAVGFADPNYFSSSFKKEFGYSPSELMK